MYSLLQGSFFLLIITLSFSICFASTDSIFSCELHKPKLPPKGDCLARLDKYPQEFEECRNGNKTCFLFLHEPAINEIDYLKTNLSFIEMQKPFLCGRYENAFESKVRLSGMAFKLHNLTDTANELCAWVGKSCEYNSLVDFVAIKANDSYRFAISGYFLEVPERQCFHDPSASIFDDSIVIIGARNATKSRRSPLTILVSPFHWGAWAIFGIIILAFVLTCFIITWHLHIYPGRSVSHAFLLLFGSNSDTMLSELNNKNAEHLATGHVAVRNGIVVSLFRMAIGTCVLIFILFYEVAVVNFLFQESPTALPSSISKLSVSNLEAYGLLKDTAIEDIWLSEVNSEKDKIGKEPYPWKRCEDSEDCTQSLQNNDIKFFVTYGIEARRFLGNKANCENFAIVDTENDLYTFNGGWLYNKVIPREYQKKIDRQILHLRRKRVLERALKDEIGDRECKIENKSSIGPLTILIPCLVLVLPPLFGSLIVLFFTRRQALKQNFVVS